jgi:hypothetical protein
MSRIRIFLLRSLFLALNIGIARVAAAGDTDFGSLLRHPHAYQHKLVSVTGIVRGSGPTMELFGNASAARAAAPASESILVIAPAGWTPDRPYAMRLVRVTGTVEAREHGYWGNPCSIHFQRIEVISERPAVPPDYAIAVIRNESSTPYVIRAGPLGVEATLAIAPNQFLELPRFDGVLKLVGSDASVISKRRLETSRRALNFDSERMVFYYRIVDGEVEGVSPRIARKWNWRR